MIWPKEMMAQGSVDEEMESFDSDALVHKIRCMTTRSPVTATVRDTLRHAGFAAVP